MSYTNTDSVFINWFWNDKRNQIHIELHSSFRLFRTSMHFYFFLTVSTNNSNNFAQITLPKSGTNVKMNEKKRDTYMILATSFRIDLISMFPHTKKISSRTHRKSQAIPVTQWHKTCRKTIF